MFRYLIFGLLKKRNPRNVAVTLHYVASRCQRNGNALLQIVR